MIETNKIWNQPWMEYSTDDKLDALKGVIMEVVEHLNEFDNTPARGFVTKEELSQELSQTFHNTKSDMEELVENQVEEWTRVFKHEHAKEMAELQKVIRNLKEDIKNCSS